MAPSSHQHNTTKVTPTKSARHSGAKVSVGTLRGTNARICRALVQLLAMGIHEPKKAFVAIMADYSGHEAGFNKAVRKAKKAGLVVYQADKSRLRISQLGFRNAPYIEPAVETADMLNHLKFVLTKKKAHTKCAQVLDMLSDGREYTFEYIAEKFGYPNHKTDGFKRFIRNLTTLHPFTKTVKNKGSSNSIMLTDRAFPQGRGPTVSTGVSGHTRLPGNESAVESIGSIPAIPEILEVPEGNLRLMDPTESEAESIDFIPAIPEIFEVPEGDSRLMDTTESAVESMESISTIPEILEVPEGNSRLMDPTESAVESMESIPAIPEILEVPEGNSRLMDTTESAVESMESIPAIPEILEVPEGNLRLMDPTESAAEIIPTNPVPEVPGGVRWTRCLGLLALSYMLRTSNNLKCG